MDRLLAFSRRRRRWLACAAAATGAYLIYHHPSVASRRRRIARVASSLASLADAVAAVASDLAAFLRSESDAIPPTVRQISKLASSPEASASASALSRALTAGVIRGYATASGPAAGGAPAFSDRLVDRLLSPSGERFASAVAGSFGRQIVVGFYSSDSSPAAGSSSPSAPEWVDVVTTGSCWRAIRSWVEVFTATAVGVFIDKTIHINTYDQLFAAATNPSHGAKLQELFAVRSFLEFVMWRLHEGARAGSDAAIGAGLSVLRHMSERNMVVAAICIALCLHVLNGTWLMARPEPAFVDQNDGKRFAGIY
uniref:Protein PHLOEM PROTEIN 2-LIKE A10 n=1 Tax=Leersia perrieri TaxID=77586 RepID=A0A0D9WV39_9ORYZ